MKKIKTNYLFVGLGNPGEEYENSRHSVGRMILLSMQRKFTSPTGGARGEVEVKDWHDEKKLKAQLAEGKLGSNKFRFLLPENFMNNSGGSVKPLVKSKAEAHNVVVLHDDVDLPLGTIKICYNRGSGGHKGVDSIVKALKTNEFARIKIGISPSTPSGKTKKPKTDKVVDFVIANFKPAEQDKLKKVIKQAKEIIASLVENGLERTMNSFN
jgi:PTH1 family peptidyl-tRNA hydrolase